MVEPKTQEDRSILCFQEELEKLGILNCEIRRKQRSWGVLHSALKNRIYSAPLHALTKVSSFRMWAHYRRISFSLYACCLIPRTEHIQESTLQMSPKTATLGGIVNSQYLGLLKYLIYFVSLIFSFWFISFCDFAANEISSKMFSSCSLFSYNCHLFSVFKCPCSSVAPWSPWTYIWLLFLNHCHVYHLSCFPGEHYWDRPDFQKTYCVNFSHSILG